MLRACCASYTFHQSSSSRAEKSIEAFTLACTLTDMACCPKLSELTVSNESDAVGATQTSNTVLARPPKADESRRVSLVSRKGGLPPLGPAASACTQRPSVVSELLMATASSKAWPCTSDFLTRSEPARSTRCSFPRRMREPDLVVTSRRSTLCERDEASFIAVADVTRFWLAAAMVATACSMPVSGADVAPVSTVPSLGSSRRSTVELGSSRS